MVDMNAWDFIRFSISFRPWEQKSLASMILLLRLGTIIFSSFRLSGISYLIGGGGGLLCTTGYLGEYESFVVLRFVLDWFLVGFHFLFLN